MPIISLIVPIFNSDKYLERCINSLINQDVNRKYYEIILVNDGSTDNSEKIAQEYAEKYDNIYLFQQKNQGSGAARNCGLNHASGKYIMFIDSDDELEYGISYLIDNIEHYKLDIVAIKLKRKYNNKTLDIIECDQPSLTKGIVLSGRNAIIKGYQPSSACALIMNKQFLIKNEIKFVPEIIHEDIVFSYTAVAKSSSIMFLDFAPYIYYTNEGSKSNSTNSVELCKYIADEISVIKSFIQLGNSVKDDNELEQAILRQAKSTLFGLIYSLFINRKNWKALGINNSIISQLEQDKLYPIRGPYNNWKQLIISKLILNHKCLFVKTK